MFLSAQAAAPGRARHLLGTCSLRQPFKPPWARQPSTPPAHLRPGGVGEEGAALGAALGAQDGQLQDVSHRGKQRPQVLLGGLQDGGQEEGEG